MHIVLLNGPPRCGKDTFVKFVSQQWPHIAHRKFSAPLKEGAAKLFQLSPAQLRVCEEDKDRPMPWLYGKTWRETQIWLSEEVMKPRFGKDVFGRILLNNLRTEPHGQYIVVSDSGFVEEAEVLMRAYGPKAVTLLELHRPEYTFAGDSRSYWAEGSGWKRTQIKNMLDLPMFRVQCLRIMGQIMGIEEAFDYKETR